MVSVLFFQHVLFIFVNNENILLEKEKKKKRETLSFLLGQPNLNKWLLVRKKLDP